MQFARSPFANVLDCHIAGGDTVKPERAVKGLLCCCQLRLCCEAALKKGRNCREESGDRRESVSEAD